MNLSELKKSEAPRVAMYYGMGCAPCQRLKPEYKTVCESIGVEPTTINSAVDMEGLREMGIRSVPTVIGVKNGEAIVLFQGYLHPEAVQRKLTEFLLANK